MEKPITFLDYDKITDDIYSLGSKLILRMNVSLTRKNDKNERNSFHREYKYDSKYSPTKLITIRRSFDYYLTLDKLDMRNLDGNIMIRPQDIIILRQKLHTVLSWFESDTFAKKNNTLIIYKRPKPEILQGLAGNRWLMFEPIVITWENTGEQTPGVRITLSNNDIFADVSIDKIYGLVYLLDSFNMYQAASTMLTYVQRPEYGYNLLEFDSSTSIMDEPQDSLGSAKNERFIETEKRFSKPKSWFDKIDGISN